MGFKSVAKWSTLGIALVLAAAPFAQSYAQAGETVSGSPANGKVLFETAVCSACHTLAAANASGPIGPSFDRNRNLSQEYIVTTLSTGRGAMPPYSGQFSKAELNDLASYILSAAAKPE